MVERLFLSRKPCTIGLMEQDVLLIMSKKTSFLLFSAVHLCLVVAFKCHVNYLISLSTSCIFIDYYLIISSYFFWKWNNVCLNDKVNCSWRYAHRCIETCLINTGWLCQATYLTNNNVSFINSCISYRCCTNIISMLQ